MTKGREKQPSGLQFWEIANRVRPLAEWQRQFKPTVKTLRMFPADYELVRRWPSLAAQYGFSFFGLDLIMFDGFELLRARGERPEEAPDAG